MTSVRVLQILPTVNNTSGIFRVAFNWHKYIDTSKIQFDYLYFSKNPKTEQTKQIIALGGCCYFLPVNNPVKFIKELIKLFKNNQYRTIHSHVLQLPIIIFPIAKFYGVKHIVQHAHATQWGDKKLSSIRNYLMIHSVWPFITDRLACSQKAGKFFFKEKFQVISNGIEVEKFVFNPDIRNKKRKELALENNFVIGHVGHLTPSKNHIFLIDIFKEIIKRKPNSRLILVGDGPLEKAIKQLVQKKQLAGKVLFLGPRNDIAELCQAFDCFVLPSLFEGLGIVAIESQASGLPCVLADTLPQEAFVCNCTQLPLGNAKQWAEVILNYQYFERKDASAQIETAGFSAKKVAQQMQNFYLELERTK